MPKSRKFKKLEQKFLTGYGRIRTEFVKYDPISLASYLHKYINNDLEFDELDLNQRLPWDQLVLIKWVLINADFSKELKKADRDTKYKILKRAWIFAQKKGLLGDFTDMHLFMRPIVFQQMNYQRPLLKSEFGRQSLLFSSLPSDHTFHQQFFEHSGLTFLEFYQYSLCLWAHVDRGNKTRFKLADFKPLEEKLDLVKFDIFIKTISKSFPELSDWLVTEDDLNGNKRSSVEYLTDTPLYKYPIVKNGEEYWVWYPTVLYRCLETYIYDTLKAVNPNKFMDKFGAIFEDYISDSISQTNTTCLRESKIQELIDEGKCIDFVLVEDTDVIFIDAKATEVKIPDRFTQSARRIQDRIKGSVLNAIEQAHSVYSQFDKVGKSIGLTREDITPYVLVVTYKEHLLGNGVTLSGSIAKDKIKAIQDKYLGSAIPLENIYCITVDNFDFMTESVRSGDFSYSDILKAAIEADNRPETRCYNFDLHLNEQKIRRMPEWILQENMSVFNGVINK